MRGLWARARFAWKALRRADQLDAAMRDEMRFHLDMEAERLVRERGLAWHEARRQAHIAFGGVEKYKEHGRDSRGLRWLDALSLDARLAIRMLVKHRGLTLVGGFAMAVAIAVGATAFEVITEVLNPVLPFEDGDRVVALQYATSTPGSPERRVLHDFVDWRQALTSVEQLGAFRTARLNLSSGQPPHEPIRVAEITASAFAVARTPPLAGRYLLSTDERDAASPVVVIGYKAWQLRFAGDLRIVGRTIDLGGIPHTVVGIMPDGFKFPVDHQFWIPLRANPLHYERLHGPELYLFGRLAPGVTLQEAQAELTTIGQRAAEAYPDTHATLRPVVLPYTREHLDITDPFRLWTARIAQLFVGALVFVVAVNLAILMYARTVTRLGEIAVRTALGASRQRILGQLFVEALALSGVGVAAGLLLAQIALDRMQSLAHLAGGLPFWIDLDLSRGTVVYAIGLAVLAAAIMGVLPGLKATGLRRTVQLRDVNSHSRTRLGAVWTMLVVAQVAVAVAVLPMAVYMAWRVVRMEVAGPGFATDRFVVGVVALGDEVSTVETGRIGGRQLELTSRLQAEPGVSAVTFSSGVPGFASGRLLQFDKDPAVKYAGTLGADTLDVGLELLDAYGAEIVAGRGFTAADLGAAHAVIVNRTFVQEFLTAGSPLGIRFRYVAPTERPGTRAADFYQIVGVINDFPSFPPAPDSDGVPTVYHPATAGTVHPFVLSVRFSGSIPAGFIDRFRAIGVEVDPALQLRRVVPLSNYYHELRSIWRYMAWGIGLLTMTVLMLSAAGIYAMMSFTVAQRTREIAIRAALGASPQRLVLSIFGRATRQLALGVLAGSLLSGAVFLNIDLRPERAVALWAAVAAIMLVVGLLAALGPMRRGLRIQPSEALRTDP